MLLAFDLDRTIVTNDHKLPIEIEQSLKKARSLGHHITVLTGRPPSATTAFLEQLDITEYYSTNHGANVAGQKGELLRWQRLSSHDVSNLLEPFLDDHKVEYACISEDVLYVRNPEDERWNWAHTQNRFVKLFDASLELHAEKLVFSTEEQGDSIASHVAENHPELVTYAWNNNYLEVTSNNSDKGSALEILAKELGFKQSETVAFGDGPNDLTMVTWAGHGVAVGPHAHMSVINAANEHIKSPEELGVKVWLEQNLFSD